MMIFHYLTGCSTKIPNWIQRLLNRNGKSAFDDYDDSEERIVGGPIALAPIPWQAHITIMVEGEPFQCGGTILDEETILSAAHCFRLGKQLGAMMVETGITANPLFERKFDINEETSNVKEVIVHPKYQSVTKGDDIAIIKLKKPLTFNKNTKPACLPEPTFSPDGELGVVSGWGRTSSSKTLV